MSQIGVPITSLLDLVDHSLAAFDERGTFHGAMDLQEYVIMDELWDLNPTSFDNGKRLEWRYIFDNDGSAKHVNRFEPTDPNYGMGRSLGFVEWVTAQGYCTFEDVLMTLDRGESALIDYMDDRYWRGAASKVEMLEETAVGAPDSATDTKNPSGFEYWVNYLNSGTTDTVGGFNGQTVIFGDGSTSTTVGGINRATQAKARNWAATKTGINMTFIDTVRRGLKATKWKVPKRLRQYVKNKESKRRALFNHNDLSEYERMVNSGGDNRNGDINPFHDEVTLLGVSTRGLPAMNGMTYSPVYIMDFRDYGPVVHRTWNWKRSKAMRDVRFHLQSVVFWDTLYNYRLKDPRRHLVVHNAVP
jgi:hypothetical protein